jgi:hypothetical protein
MQRVFAATSTVSGASNANLGLRRGGTIGSSAIFGWRNPPRWNVEVVSAAGQISNVGRHAAVAWRMNDNYK